MRTNYKILVLIIFLIPVLIIVIRNNYISSSKKHNLLINNEPFIKNLKTIHNNYFKYADIILFIDYEDFSCLQCENQIIYFCKWIEKNLDSLRKENVLLLVRKRKDNEQYYNWLITNWIERNKISLIVRLDNDNLFNKLKLNKSSMVIFNFKNSDLIVYKEFPLLNKEIKELTIIINALPVKAGM